jgi:hypothetical protein
MHLVGNGREADTKAGDIVYLTQRAIIGYDDHIVVGVVTSLPILSLVLLFKISAADIG